MNYYLLSVIEDYLKYRYIEFSFEVVLTNE